jgi:hypothetical protein
MRTKGYRTIINIFLIPIGLLIIFCVFILFSGSSNKEISDSTRKEILKKAEEMANVKWTPKYDLNDKSAKFTFSKGKTYTGIPYSMDVYQATSAREFLKKIKNSSELYGNDCSGYVSAAWGISRQTTLTLYNAVEKKEKIDGRYIKKISWDEIKPADALLVDDGKGKGHVMLYVESNKGNKDELIIYEQNVVINTPNGSVPVARKDVRSQKALIKDGYIPIRLMRK